MGYIGSECVQSGDSSAKLKSVSVKREGEDTVIQFKITGYAHKDLLHDFVIANRDKFIFSHLNLNLSDNGFMGEGSLGVGIRIRDQEPENTLSPLTPYGEMNSKIDELEKKIWDIARDKEEKI